MKNDDIKKLVLGLPDDSPFEQEMRRRFFPRQQVLSSDDRLVYPMRDPAFCFHLPYAYARAAKWLPDEVTCSYIWRAFSHLYYKIKNDPAGSEARALGHPVNRAKQALVKALLCTGLSYAEVAKLSGLSADVVETFAHWFFDFPDRRDDETFVMNVLNPRIELSLIRSDRRPDPVLLLMRLGYQQGPEAVIREAKLKGQWKDASGDQSANLKHILLSDATTKAKMGLLESDDPGFIAFKALAAAEAKHQPQYEDDDFRMGLGALSMDAGAQLVIKQIALGSALEKLKAGQALDAQQAAQMAKNKEVLDIGSA